MTAGVLGALLLTAGGAGLGWAAGEELRAKAAALDGLRAGVAVLAREIGFYRRAVPDALELAARSTHGTAERFFRACAHGLERERTTVAQAWRRALEETLGGLAPEEREALLQLGEVLGRYDSEIQCRTLEDCAARLEEARQRALDEWRRQSRLLLVLGGAGGALLALLLL